MYSIKIAYAKNEFVSYRVHDQTGVEIASCPTPESACSVLRGLELLAEHLKETKKRK